MENQLPSVSVVVPTYNRGPFLARCLRSLQNQTLSRERFEVLVVDDGSHDGTPEVLEKFGSFVKTIKNTVNLGLPASLNRGIRASNADYIVRVDSDDYVSNDFLKLLLWHIEEYSASAVACDYWEFNEAEAWERLRDATLNPIGCGIMFRKAALLEIGLYDEAMRLDEDRELMLRFSQRFELNHLSLALYRYRRHKHSLTKGL